MLRFRILTAIILVVWGMTFLLIQPSQAVAAGRCRVDSSHQKLITTTKSGEAIYANPDSLGLWEIAKELCVSYELLVAYNYILIPREPDDWFEIKIPPARSEIAWLPGTSLEIPDHARLPSWQQIFFDATDPEAFLWPVDAETAIITQFYREGHRGIDLALESGATVQTIGNGRVDRVYTNHHVFGKAIVIDHGNDLYAIYAHLSAISIEANTLVQRGQTIGRVGTTGRSSGPHLHLELRDAFAPIDPCRYFEECKTSIFH